MSLRKDGGWVKLFWGRKRGRGRGKEREREGGRLRGLSRRWWEERLAEGVWTCEGKRQRLSTFYRSFSKAAEKMGRAERGDTRVGWRGSRLSGSRRQDRNPARHPSGSRRCARTQFGSSGIASPVFLVLLLSRRLRGNARGRVYGPSECRKSVP